VIARGGAAGSPHPDRPAVPPCAAGKRPVWRPGPARA